MLFYRYCFTTPKNPAVCCNQLMCLDLNNLDNGWFELPWLSKAHMAECDFYLQGFKMKLIVLFFFFFFFFVLKGLNLS
jgi:hypothetical protein